MTSASVREAVFVINQDVPLAAVRRLVQEIAAEHVLILSTHLVFASERTQLQDAAFKVDVATFADMLTEQEMLECDANASEEGRRELMEHGRGHYARFFMRASRRFKNERVCAKAQARWPDARFFHAGGIGIDAGVWQAVGSVPIRGEPRGGRDGSTLKRLRGLFAGEINLITCDRSSHCAVVLGSVRRINCRIGVRVIRIAWPLAWGLTNPRLNALALAAILRIRGAAADYDLCVAVHEYNIGMSRAAETLGKVLHILIDGHHPSNFPPSYIEMFDVGRFVAVSPLSGEWFRRHGREVAPGLSFQAPLRFRYCIGREIRQVMLVLNHAGDWSALIGRSDTDLLVAAFIDLARYYPDLAFVIRLHPTMATVEHEGVESMRRIERLVADSGTANLAISHQTLEEDLCRGDLYISEYSQVLIDAWARGKLGVVVNLSHRRSFMGDYEGLGFPSVASLNGLRAFVERATNVLEAVVDEQNTAVERFNAMADRWQGPGDRVGG